MCSSKENNKRSSWHSIEIFSKYLVLYLNFVFLYLTLLLTEMYFCSLILISLENWVWDTFTDIGAKVLLLAQ